MICNALPINLYHKYRQEKLSPFLLESLGPITPYSSKSILGAHAKRKLLCIDGKLFEDGKVIGKALDLFSHLEIPKGDNFFPAWMGVFNYEFARYFGLPSKNPIPGLPEAMFYYYEEGHVWESSDFTPYVPLVYLKDDSKKSPYSIGKSQDQFPAAFSKVASSIADGDVYQVNLAQRFSFDAQDVDFFDLYQRMRMSNPSPFMGMIEDNDWAIACASPERLFSFRNNIISSRPIAGTRPRGKAKREDEELEMQLLASTKERAEHAMLVDLVRNDLARVCDTGSVHVNEAYIVERYSHVMHLVSEISGRSEASLLEIFSSIFPAGTITGTPKESAMQHIKELEPFARGQYTGSMGYVSARDGADFNILIRSAFREANVGHIWAGSGIVAKSNAPGEDDEVLSKAKSVSNALQNIESPAAPALPLAGITYPRTKPTKRFKHRVLFVENHDSFSHNIIDAVKRLGCDVEVADHHEAVDLSGFRHVILGPGPKRPEEAGNLMRFIDTATKLRCAILGICLGHQALGQYFGAKLIKAKRAIHGETDSLTHLGHPLFTGVPEKFLAMRYHSLVITQIPGCFQVVAYSPSDEVMAIAHGQHPWFGVQFHPESFLSEGGEQIFANFFELTP